MTTSVSVQHKPSFGLWRATSLVVGNIVGSGILLLPASLGLYGSLGLVGWGLTTVGAICVALVFARLAKRIPKIGGPYAYAHEAFGDFVGFQMAWSYWVGLWAGNAAVATAFVSYLTTFWPVLGQDMTLGFTVAAGSIWVFTLLNAFSLKLAGSFQVFATIVKVLPLVAIGIFGVFYIDFGHFTPLNPSGQPTLTALGSTLALTLFAFLGIESATVPAEDVINPEKTIPRATVLGTLASAGIYTWVMVVMLGLIPPHDLAQSNAPFADAGRIVFGDWAVPILSFSAAMAAFLTLNGWVLLQGQVPLAAARDGLFPPIFAKETKNGTPAWGLVLSSCLIMVMLAMNYQASLVEQFTTIILFTTFVQMLPYLYSCAAELLYLLTATEPVSRVQFVRTIAVTALGFIFTVAIVVGVGQKQVYLGMLFIFAGFPVYVWLKRKQSRESRKVPA
ncbi:MAG: amino acid permease [Pseudomonadota bacterium]